MKPGTIAILSLLTILGFTGWGILEEPLSCWLSGQLFDWGIVREPAIMFASIGVGAGTCVAAGLAAVGRVRSGRWTRGIAAASVFGAALGSMVLQGVALALMAAVTEMLDSNVHLFRGEAGWAVIVATIFMFWIAVGTWLVFTLSVLLVKRSIRPSMMNSDNQTR